MSTLYLVATPIGNLEDMSERGNRILSEVSLIAAEDTRRTRHLLTHFGIATPLLSYHAHNERGRRARLLAALDHGDVALVSDAGTPGISDPGNDLIAAVVERGHTVSPIPGPSALTAAVSVSGLVTGPFLTLGFLPRQKADRQRLIGQAAVSPFPIVLFEAPSRLRSTLLALTAAWGNRPAALMRELTKRHEEIVWGTLDDLLARYADDEPRGEIVLVVGASAGDTAVDLSDAADLLQRLRQSGVSPSQAAREVASITGLKRSDLYELAQRSGGMSEAANPDSR
ncbi:MAG: 16S rRNA (cytidine(1402)-2'-O)-methyltransferase [Chloroflexota bacterium]|nr:16S rRNA (cytidine(1402)-2'-O)-methyltransferase [Chloroflexota bacterium]